jgi:glycosyltransferase involved in cell wall biosynthesis/SAM-dependent methyltransferase
MSSEKHPYDNEYYEDNVYGHALALLKQNRVQPKPGQIHLDLGCGFGRIAEPLVSSLELQYVGVDQDRDGLASLSQRGFEVHELNFREEESTLEALRSIIGHRTLASLTMLDTLEHLPSGGQVLRVLRRLAAEHQALVVISVPNVAHRDVGLKLVTGSWEYTEAGLLDHTHVRFFTSKVLESDLRAAGLHPVGRNDVLHANSDQHFPEDHPVLAENTLLSATLRKIQERAHSEASVVQFVCICAPGPCVAVESFIRQREPARPFLSIVTRTQGRRLHTLREVFVSLAGQTCVDFEVIVVGHRLDLPSLKAVERLIDDNPEWLRNKIRLVRVEDGNRTRPLNVGFEAADGHYMSVLDDDDLPLAHWVETFKKLSKGNHGKLLRVVAVKQDVANVSVLGQQAARATTSPQKIYASTFDLIENLRTNSTPPVGIAFPRGTFHILKMRFDESLTTTEDWDYILRVASLVGVACSPEITCIYRWWESEESSRTEHCTAEWQKNHRRIYDKLDGEIILLPPGSTMRLRNLLDERDALIAQRDNLAAKATLADQAVAERDGLQREKDSLASRLADAQYERYRLTRKLFRAVKYIGGIATFRIIEKRRLNRDREVILNSKLFDKTWYLEQYPDVRRAGVDPALHYLKRGASEGRNPGPEFNSNQYLLKNRDVKLSGQNPLLHYLRYGIHEGREISPVR